jgi:hypothetical protein
LKALPLHIVLAFVDSFCLYELKVLAFVDRFCLYELKIL